MIKTIFVNHSEKLSVTQRGQESNHKGRGDSGRESKMCDSSRKSAIVTCHTCKIQGIK